MNPSLLFSPHPFTTLLHFARPSSPSPSCSYFHNSSDSLSIYVPVDAPTSIQTLGTAVSVPSIIRLGYFKLTDSSGSLYNAPLPLSYTNMFSFSANFSITGFEPGGWPPYGEGMAFVVTKPTGLGSGSRFFGLQDIGNYPFIAIEFDVHEDAEYSDPNDNHIGIDSNSIISLATGIPPFKLLGGTQIYVWVDYDGPSSQVLVYATNESPIKPASPLLSTTVNVLAALDLLNQPGPVYMGFCSATSTLSSLFTINSLCFSNGRHLCTAELSPAISMLPVIPPPHIIRVFLTLSTGNRI